MPNAMNDKLEEELRQALTRTEPPPDFAARVLARIAAEQAAVPNQLAVSNPANPPGTRASEKRTGWTTRLAEWLAWPRWQLAGALACACLLLGVWLGVQRQHAQQQALAARAAQEAAEGERAKEQVMLALEIASAKLNVAQRKLNEQ